MDWYISALQPGILAKRESLKMNFKERILTVHTEPLYAVGIDALQVNLGYKCNMACKHCHVQSGPHRKEMMGPQNIEEVIRVLKENRIKTLDITGGAPELNSWFRPLVEQAKYIGCHVIARSNLTIFFEDGMEDLFEFYSRNNVEIIASLPWYSKESVDIIRGNGSFLKSIHALQKLNSLGYGQDTRLKKLNLVYNPGGAFLPAVQSALEGEYRIELEKKFAISFDSLYAFTNMPIGRFREFLIRTGKFDNYIKKLKDAFNPETLSGLMCRHTISVGWDGKLYDCDFNQMIGLSLLDGYPRTIKDFDHHLLANRQVAVDDHCHGCTAGHGST